MGKKFDLQSIYEEETWTVMYENAEGKKEEFYSIVQREIEMSNWPNLEVTIDEYQSGSWLAEKETTKMLKMKATKSQFKKFEIFFRAQMFGNVVIFSRYECMERGFWDKMAVKTGPELRTFIRDQCKNLAQWEEFIGIDNLANILYWRAMEQLDPDIESKKKLLSK